MAVKLSNPSTNLQDISKQYRTCTNCRQRFNNKRKRPAETNNLPDDELEIIDLEFLSEIVINLLKNTEPSGSELHLHCGVNISDCNDSNKNLANEIIELIEDADGYNWIYNRQYECKESTTYWYFCSQRNTLLKSHVRIPIYQSNKICHQWKDSNVKVF